MAQAFGKVLFDLFMEFYAFTALPVSGAVGVVARTFFDIGVVAGHTIKSEK